MMAPPLPRADTRFESGSTRALAGIAAVASVTPRIAGEGDRARGQHASPSFYPIGALSSPVHPSPRANRPVTLRSLIWRIPAAAPIPDMEAPPAG